MPTTSRNPVTISANEDMQTLLELGPGEYRVDVEYGLGVTGTAAMKQTVDPNNTNADFPISVNAEDVSLTGSGGFIHVGPCYIGMTIANLSGGSIVISANRL